MNNYNVFQFLNGFDLILDKELTELNLDNLNDNCSFHVHHVKDNHYFILKENLTSDIIKENLNKLNFIFDESIEQPKEKQDFYVHLFNEGDDEPEYFTAGIESKVVLDKGDTIEYTCERLQHYFEVIHDLGLCEEKVLELWNEDYVTYDEIVQQYFSENEYYNFILIKNEDDFYEL